MKRKDYGSRHNMFNRIDPFGEECEGRDKVFLHDRMPGSVVQVVVSRSFESVVPLIPIGRLR